MQSGRSPARGAFPEFPGRDRSRGLGSARQRRRGSTFHVELQRCLRARRQGFPDEVGRARGAAREGSTSRQVVFRRSWAPARERWWGRDSDERVWRRSVMYFRSLVQKLWKKSILQETQKVEVFHSRARRHASLDLAATAEIPFATASAAFAVPRPTEESTPARQIQGPEPRSRAPGVPRWRPRPEQGPRRWGRAGQGTRRRGERAPRGKRVWQRKSRASRPVSGRHG